MKCPRCEQGDVVKAELKKSRQEIFVCTECEATWFSINDIGFLPFIDLGTFMESSGLSPLWNELTIQND